MSIHTNRKITLLQASSINMIDMVGIGPFVVMPLVVSKFHDGLFIWAWIFGALNAVIDGMIWSELGARYPLAGGTYNFLRIAFGQRGGKLMSFLFTWQTIIQGPLVVASASVGFAQYLTYLVPLDHWQLKLVSGLIILVVFLLLYRKIETIGKISVLLWSIVIITVLWIIISGFAFGKHDVPVMPAEGSTFFSSAFWAAVGFASLKTVYSYLGYYNVCHLGSEIKNPGVNIPRSIFISIIGIATLYLLMNFSVMSVVPWQNVRADERYLVSSFMEQIYGHTAAVIVTILILIIAFSSLFAVVLGYSRVPYASAVDGNFFKIFARLHPKKEFPYISLIFLCVAGFIVSLFVGLEKLISAILAMRIIIQFLGQAVGVVLLRARSKSSDYPFRMWLYPLPVILSVLIWSFLFFSTGWYAIGGITVASIGAVVFFIKQSIAQENPKLVQ